MKRNLLIFKSPLHDQTSVLAVRQPMLDALKEMDVEVLDAAQGEAIFNRLQPTDKTICFIGTGGTEENFRAYYQQLTEPIILLSDGYHNSFAAAFEIATFLHQRGIAHRLVNLPLECTNFDCIRELYSENEIVQNKPLSVRLAASELYSHPAVAAKLKEAVIGLIGGSSSWLIASNVDTDYVSQQTGAKFVKISIQEVEETYKSLLTDGLTDLQQAETMYQALSLICAKYSLNALTIKCFDLLDSCKTTACYALAKLNDEGIISGCEGDIPALWTMIIASALTGKAPFMANPSSSNAAERTVDFAHCTIPFHMVTSYTLPSHFESGIGIGIAGQLQEGDYQILKIGGEHLDQVFSCKGRIICNTHIKERCRTQIRFQFPTPEAYTAFLQNRTGNHIILYKA